MPLQAPLQEDFSMNAWLEQTTQELNDVQDDAELLRLNAEALTTRVSTTETNATALTTRVSTLENTRTVTLAELQTVTAAAADFAAFKVAIAALT